GAPTHCSLRQAAKASVLHTDIPRFESWSEHQSRFVSLRRKPLRDMQGTRGSSPRRSTNQLCRSSKAERPADNRKTADRSRAGEPATGDQHVHDDQETGAAGRRSSIADGPGAFKPEMVG